MQSNSRQCELCEVEVEHTHKHHLIPQEKSKGMAPDFRHATIECCLPCGKQVHALFTNGEMKRQFNSLEKLKTDSRIQNWILWRRKHPSVNDIKYSGKS